ncbi:MAG: flavodoxin family protein [Leptolyngbya sp. RL_3_1]|nr:flavodoxin family protein [Leptolyngbya sp. RL_3_1]
MAHTASTLITNRSPTVIGLVGSYRKQGTIDTAVSAILQAAAAKGAHTEKIYLQDQHIEFCTNCRHCLQVPGRGECLLKDDMATLLDRIEAADALVLGAPVNFGHINALTQRFLERTVCYGYWPWDAHAPVSTKAKPTKKAVLVTSSAMPSLIGRWLTGAMKALKDLARMLNAKPIGTWWLGMIDPHDSQLSSHQRHRAQALGTKLVA